MRAKIDTLHAAVAAVERKLKNQKFDYDIFASADTGLDFEIKKGQLQRHTLSSETGLALRLFHQGRLGFAYTRSLAPAHLGELVKKAQASLALCGKNSGFVLGRPKALSHTALDLDLFDPNLITLPFAEKLAILKQFERDIFSASNAISDTDGTSWTEVSGYTQLVNRQGFSIAFSETAVAVGAEAIARRKSHHASFADAQNVRFFDDLSLKTLAIRLAHQATSGLGAKEPKTGNFSVVLEPQVAAEILEVLAPSFYGDEVLHHRSFLDGKMGAAIFSPLISIVDDGRMPRAWGSCLFDGEGMASQRTALIAQGSLEGVLHDASSAQKTQTISTGNSKREGLGSLPRVGHHTLFIKNGKTPKADLLRGLNPGILLTKVMGVHMANTLTGDFALGGSGFWVERGQIIRPVSDFTISGNLFAMMKNLIALGADLEINGGYGSPSWLVPPLKVAGS